MPFSLKLKIEKGKDLPVMNENSQSCDAYVEIKFKSDSRKTDVCWKNLNPVWNSDWFTLEIDDNDIMTEYLYLRIMDHDNYSANNMIGRIIFHLYPILSVESGKISSNWLPIFDSVYGIRGWIYVSYSLHYISIIPEDAPMIFKELYIPILSIRGVPSGYTLVQINGFIEESILEVDPDHEWMDIVRSQRASNDIRQRTFTKISDELQFKVVQRAKFMKANTILGYKQYFSLEKEYGLYCRAICTCVTLEKGQPPTSDTCQSVSIFPSDFRINSIKSKFHDNPDQYKVDEGIRTSPANSNVSINEEDDSVSESSIILDSIPIITMGSFYPMCFSFIGGMVAAYSVQAISKKDEDSDVLEVRNYWWKEIHQELRFHAKSMNCSAIVDYSEKIAITNDNVMLMGFGTAVNFNDEIMEPSGCNPICSKCEIINFSFDLAEETIDIKCRSCGKNSVPLFLLATIAIEPSIKFEGRGIYVHLKVEKELKPQKMSDSSYLSRKIPFIESEMMSKMLKKLKVKGMNSIFDVNTQIVISENRIIMTRSGTAYCLESLPIHSLPPMSSKISQEVNEYHSNFIKFNGISDFSYFEIPRFTKSSSSSDQRVQKEYEKLSEPVFRNVGEVCQSDLSYIFDPFPIPNCVLYSTSQPELFSAVDNIQIYTTLTVGSYCFDIEAEPKKEINSHFNDLISTNMFNGLALYPSVFLNLNTSLDFFEEKSVSFILTSTYFDLSQHKDLKKSISPIENSPDTSGSVFNQLNSGDQSFKDVLLFNTDYVPFENIHTTYLSYLNYCFIKEMQDAKESGLKYFISIFIQETLTIFKSLSKLVGANAIASFKVDHFKIFPATKRNQTQCIISLSGNAVRITKKK